MPFETATVFSPHTMWSRYLRLLQTRPGLTNAATAGTIALSGDVLAQELDSWYIKGQGLVAPSALDFRRLAVVAGWGFTWLGAPMYYWFRTLDRWFPPGVGGMSSILKKITVNQTTVAPLSNAAFFLYIQVRVRALGG